VIVVWNGMVRLKTGALKLLSVFCFVLMNLAGFTQSRLPVCGPYAKFYGRDSINIVTFGASTVEGVPVPLNFQAPLRSFLENCYGSKTIVISNNGVAGETTTQGLSRIDGAISGKTGFLFILMGANDVVQIANGEAVLKTTLNNMKVLIEKGKRNNLRVIVGTIQYFEEFPGNSPKAKFSQRRNRIVDQVNNGYKKLAQESDVRIADINAVIGKNRQLYSDEVHPNRRGYYVMALVWFDALNQEIIENFLAPGIVQNYPNPANGFTRLGFTLNSAGRVKVTLFNTIGQRMGVVFDDYRNAGYQEEEISTIQYPAGLYILQYELPGLKVSRKMLIYH